MHERSPAVLLISVNLKNGQRDFSPGANVQLAAPDLLATILAVFFELRQKETFTETSVFGTAYVECE